MFSNLMQWEKYSKIGGDKEKMMRYAGRFGYLLNAFTGEHVGEPGLLICLYDEPLLHVDIKFVMVEEFGGRVEDLALLLDKGGVKGGIEGSTAHFPGLDYQWRFWIWIHYTLLKVGRGVVGVWVKGWLAYKLRSNWLVGLVWLVGCFRWAWWIN